MPCLHSRAPVVCRLDGAAATRCATGIFRQTLVLSWPRTTLSQGIGRLKEDSSSYESWVLQYRGLRGTMDEQRLADAPRPVRPRDRQQDDAPGDGPDAPR